MVRPRGRTLSARLIAIMAVLLTLACAVVGGATYLAVHRQLISALDQQVQSATQRWADCVTGPGRLGGPDRDRAGQGYPRRAPGNPGHCFGQLPSTFQAQLAGTTWSCYSATPANTCTLSAADKRALAALPASGVPAAIEPAPSTPAYTVPVLGKQYRVTKIRITGGAEAGVILVAGLPLATTQHTIDTVLITEVIAFGIVLVLAAGSGIWLIRLSLRPLRRVAATATAVAELPLESGEVALPAGVPDTNPGTEVGQVGAAFNRMLGHIERALGRRAASETRLRRFAADASHELRTPLTAIRGYSELALRHPGPVPEEVRHALGRVQSESARMSVLVDDLLLLARLDAGRPLASDPVDLSRLCIDATSDARAASDDHRWRLELPDDPVVVPGDEHRLHQVLANLLGNAGQHTPAGTTVTVTLTDPGPVTITVHDDGPGIAADLIPELFERFTRADTSRWRADDGSGASTGLGLAIADAVVTAHGGSIEVSSRPGSTQFTITLPRVP